MSSFKSYIMDYLEGKEFLKNHTKVFMDYWGYDIPEDVDCIICGNFAIDVHHIKGRGAGGDKHHYKDHPTNLASLCRACHEKTASKKFNAFVYTKLLERIIEKVEKDGRI